MSDEADKLFDTADEMKDIGSILDATHVTIKGKSGKWTVILSGLRGTIGLIRCASHVEAESVAKTLATLARKAARRPIGIEHR